MKNFKIALILVLLGFTIYLCFRNHKLSKEVNLLNELKFGLVKTDTVYLNKPFFSEKRFLEDHQPMKILVYDSKKSVADDTVKTSLITDQDSLVQFLLKKDQLDISLFNKPTETYSTKQFKIDLNRYQYNWLDGKLSKKKISKVLFKPYLYGKYRPFNSLFDIGSGISIETKRFNYKLGINAFYYPKLKSGINTDIEFQVTYNF